MFPKMSRHRPALCVLTAAVLLCAAAPPAVASESHVFVREVIDGDTVRLADGRLLRLVGINAPELHPPGDAAPWPLAEKARLALLSLAGEKRCRLEVRGRPRDRHGRLLAHMYCGDVWVQGALLRLGLAWVYSFADNRAELPEMLALERKARRAARGVWAEPFYAVRRPEQARRYIGSFQLVEGRIVATAEVRGTTYLNFGADWRSDFTVAITPRHAALFKETSPHPLALQGRRVRVRGWLIERNGPMIQASHPEQIEVLDATGEGY